MSVMVRTCRLQIGRGCKGAEGRGEEGAEEGQWKAAGELTSDRASLPRACVVRLLVACDEVGEHALLALDDAHGCLVAAQATVGTIAVLWRRQPRQH